MGYAHLIHPELPKSDWLKVQSHEDALILVAMNRCHDSKHYEARARTFRKQYKKRLREAFRLLENPDTPDAVLTDAWVMAEAAKCLADTNRQIAQWIREWEALWSCDPYAAAPFFHANIKKLGYDAEFRDGSYYVWRAIH